MLLRDSSAQATLVGLTAPVFWGMSVGLARSVCEDVGVARGFTLVYIASVAYLLWVVGRPRLSAYSLKYLVFGIGAACTCSLCFGLSLNLSEGGTQTMQVGMVNYLWPSLTVLAAVLFNGEKARWWLVPGLLVSLLGVVVVLGGDEGLDVHDFAANAGRNPWSYGVALLGALAWAAYSAMTRAWARGQNPVVIIFTFDILLYGLLWALGIGGEPPESVPLRGWFSVLAFAFVTGSGYAAWNYGVIRGSITLLAIASYFTPVLSCLFASFWIGADLSLTFWKGVALVVLGSLTCWHATKSAKGRQKG